MKFHLLLPVVLVVGKLLGELAHRSKASEVVGQILTGILLGPAAIGFIPSASADATGFELMRELGHIGLCVLLFEMGLKTRFEHLVAVWRPATSMAAVGVALPFLLGWATASACQWSQPAALFAGATLTAGSISVTASVLTEMKVETTREGRVILSAALFDDLAGLLLLSLLGGLVSAEVSAAARASWALAQASLFIGAGVFLGPFVARGIVRLADWMHSRAMLLVLAFSFLLLLAQAAKVAGFEKVIGAYAAGLAFARHHERERLAREFEPMTALLTPLFFVMVGASVTFSGIAGWTVAMLLVAAAAGKLFAPFLVRRGGLDPWVIGCAMVARGGVAFVLAQTALAAGAFSAQQFSALALALFATTVIGPVVFRLAWSSGVNRRAPA